LIVADANVYVDAVVHDATKVLGAPPSLAHIPSLPPRIVHPALHLLAWSATARTPAPGPGSRSVTTSCSWWSTPCVARTGPSTPSGHWPNARSAATTPTCREPSTTAPTRRTTSYWTWLFTPTPTLIVTNDSDLLQPGRVRGWKGRPIIDTHRFTPLADGAA